MAIKKPLVETSGIVQEMLSGHYLGVSSLAVAENATSPDPGGTSARGVSVWSTIEGKTLTWNGTNWIGTVTTVEFDYGMQIALNSPTYQ